MYNDKSNDKFKVFFYIINRVKLINNRMYLIWKMCKIEK